MKDELGVSSAHLGPVTNQSWGTITIFKGDSRNGYTYSDDDFKYVASHEFGHIIGLHDAYTLSNPPTSVMNAFGTNVQAIDVARVIKAYTTRTSQRYE